MVETAAVQATHTAPEMDLGCIGGDVTREQMWDAGLVPEEIMRVMDAAGVIRRRREALVAHGAFDREAAIRDIQTMYEELGELVERDVIEKALDEHLSRRFVFTPRPHGLTRVLARLYVERGVVGRRVLLPVGALVALVWAGMQGADVLRRHAVERDLRVAEERATRLVELESEVGRLASATGAAVVGEEAQRRLAALGVRAGAQGAAGDVEALSETVALLQALHDQVSVEAELVVVGGVWRQSNDDPAVRNYYLRVQALDPTGRAVPFRIRSEEDGSTSVVEEWAERVPKDLYDRIALDKQDNGIIDDEHFGTKDRGFVVVVRRYEELGQLWNW